MGYIDDPSGKREIQELWRAIRALQAPSSLRSASVTDGQTRFKGPRSLIVIGSADIEGTLAISGILNGDGTITWTGPANFNGTTTQNGPYNVVGLMTVTGNADFNGIVNIDGPLGVNGLAFLRGNTELTGDLNVLGGGKIVAAGMTLEAGILKFDTGGRLESYPSGLVLSSGSGPDVVVSSGGVSITGGGGKYFTVSAGGLFGGGDFTLAGDFSAASKSFLIPHPTKAGKLLRHGSTEGPTHGVEYHGTATFDANGEATAQLPDYFERITLPEGRTVQVTPKGAFFPFGADDVLNGKVTLYGEAGRSAFWLVKATRELFDIEPDAPTGT